MAEYVTTFTKPYPSGYQDLPSEATPVGHEIIESWENAIVSLESYLSENNIQAVSANTTINSGTKTATITIDGTEYIIYSPSVSYESAITGGTKVGTITVGTNTFDVYAPTSSAGGSTVSVVPKTLTGTNIAEITVDGTTYQLYAPTSGGSGSTVTAEATLTEGTQIGKITIDGVETILYAPTASTITVDSELSATSENAIQNKAVDAAVKNLQQQIDAGGTGGSVTVDSALSTTSENPVQNKVVTAELNKKIETLDDESQAPDAVNFDLDSELSLTSVKGVQNKAIAEEFQKYANGTKVVAKATEADTATTASNAEKVNGHTVGADVPSNAVFTDTVYDDSAVKASIQNIVNGTTQVGSATKATQDAQGNVINETYAKKTEIPQGTVVDDALSSTSTNPVQNKVVKAEFDKVNSNLSALNNSKLKGYTVKYDVPANSGGWHKIAQITGGYFNFDLYATGGWTSQRKSNAHFQIQNINGTVRIVQLSGLADTGGGIRKIRMVRVVDDNNTWILEEHSISSSTGEFFKFTIAGDVEVTPLGGSVDTTTDFKDSVSLDVSDIPTGTVITTSNIDNALSSTSTNPVQNKVVKAEFDQVNSNLTDLKVGEIAGGKNLIDYSKVIFGYELDTGNLKVNANWYVTDYIKVKPNTTYTLSGTSSTYFCEFTVDKTVIRPNNASTFTTGSTTYYLRFNSIIDGYSTPQLEEGDTATPYEPYIPSVKILAEEVNQQKNDLSNLKDGTTSVAKAVSDEDGNNIKSTYATKTEVVAVEDVEVEFNSELFSNPTYYCKCIGKMCFLYFTTAFKKSGSISHLTSLISIKNSKYYAITDYGASRLFIGSYGGSADLKGNLVMHNQSTIAVQSDTNNVLETEAMWGSIQWMIK